MELGTYCRNGQEVLNDHDAMKWTWNEEFQLTHMSYYVITIYSFHIASLTPIPSKEN